MPKLQFSGTFSAAGYSSLRDLIDDWIGWPTVKHRTLGEELEYSDDTAYLHCQSSVASPGPLESFLAEGSFTGAIDEGRARFDRLPELCARHGVGCELVASPLDDSGASAGEDSYVEVATP